MAARRPDAEPDPENALSYSAEGLADLQEYDAPAEVDAAFVTQRRIAVGYCLLFLLVTFAIPVLTVSSGWWIDARVVGGMSPSFLMAGVGLYVFFVGLGLAAATLADSSEDRMLGRAGDHGDAEDGP
ncbi:hypothetical protein [Egicoccus sp. AB-alg6-2]|uniref:hypothetical protein n=1 Tax=Egicoccus sp. AB-alg6-2 TaxID=3242692 RepID=UPI00359CE4DD